MLTSWLPLLELLSLQIQGLLEIWSCHFSPGQSTVQSHGMLAIAINVTLGTQTPYNSAEFKKKLGGGSTRNLRSYQGFKCGLQEPRTAEALTSEMLAEKRHNVYWHYQQKHLS